MRPPYPHDFRCGSRSVPFCPWTIPDLGFPSCSLPSSPAAASLELLARFDTSPTCPTPIPSPRISCDLPDGYLCAGSTQKTHHAPSLTPTPSLLDSTAVTHSVRRRPQTTLDSNCLHAHPPSSPLAAFPPIPDQPSTSQTSLTARPSPRTLYGLRDPASSTMRYPSPTRAPSLTLPPLQPC